MKSFWKSILLGFFLLFFKSEREHCRSCLSASPETIATPALREVKIAFVSPVETFLVGIYCFTKSDTYGSWKSKSRIELDRAICPETALAFSRLCHLLPWVSVLLLTLLFLPNIAYSQPETSVYRSGRDLECGSQSHSIRSVLLMIKSNTVLSSPENSPLWSVIMMLGIRNYRL